MSTTDTTERAQVTASQVKEEAKELFEDARALVAEQAPVQRERIVEAVKGIGDEIVHSELASSATDVAHQVADKSRDLAHRRGREQPGLLRRLGASLRNHPVRYLLGTAAVGAAAGGVIRQRRQAAIVTSTSGAPAYGEDTPGYRTQPGPVTESQTETSAEPFAPTSR